MAKAQVKKREPSSDTAEEIPNVEAKSRSAKKLLIAAALMSMISLAGGFFLARMAYLEDASAYEPDYVEQHDEGEQSAKAHEKPMGGVVDPLAKNGHPASDAMVLNQSKNKGDHGESKDSIEEVDNGLLDFGAIMTNIGGFDAQGMPTRAFLKVDIILVYRPDPGAAELVRSREPFMRDLFNGYLRGLNETDVRGMSGVLNLKAELLKRARAGVGSDLPQEILISDLIVQ